MALNNPNLYAFHPDHTKITAHFGDFTTEFVKSYEVKPGDVKETLIYGKSKTPIGRTEGKRDDAEVSVTLYYAGWNDFRDYLITKATNKKLSGAILDVTFLVEAADGVKKVEAIAARCVSCPPLKSDEGESPLEVELKFSVANVLDNGFAII